MPRVELKSERARGTDDNSRQAIDCVLLTKDTGLVENFNSRDVETRAMGRHKCMNTMGSKSKSIA